MRNKHINQDEIKTILDSFSSYQEEFYKPSKQSKSFKFFIISFNVYILVCYISLNLVHHGVIMPADPTVLEKGFLDIFIARANGAFWLLAAMNICLFFNIFFKSIVLITLVYCVNSFVDSFVLFGTFVDANRPALSVYSFSRPFMLIALIGLLMTHNPPKRGQQAN